MRRIKIVFTCLTLLFFGAMLISRYCMPARDTGNPESSGTSYAKNVQTAEAAESKESHDPPTTNQNVYEIKEYKGNIAVFESGSSKPFRTTDIAVKSLPVADQSDLMKGIEVHSQEELQSLLEDYLS